VAEKGEAGRRKYQIFPHLAGNKVSRELLYHLQELLQYFFGDFQHKF